VDTVRISYFSINFSIFCILFFNYTEKRTGPQITLYRCRKG
jgi:hypothetical protein